MAHRRAWPLCFSGQLPLARPGAESLYRLAEPARARYLRLTLTKSHPTWWWSVERLAVLAPQSGSAPQAGSAPQSGSAPQAGSAPRSGGDPS